MKRSKIAKDEKKIFVKLLFFTSHGEEFFKEKNTVKTFLRMKRYKKSFPSKLFQKQFLIHYTVCRLLVSKAFSLNGG